MKQMLRKISADRSACILAVVDVEKKEELGICMNIGY